MRRLSRIDCFPLCNARVNGIAYFSAATARIVKVYFTSRSGEWKRSRSTPGVSAATRDFAIRRGTTIVSPLYSLN